MLAYKLFYVGCSRVKKELTVFVSADKVKSYKQQFIDTFSKMEFQVDISHILGNLITVIFDYQILRKPLKILSL